MRYDYECTKCSFLFEIECLLNEYNPHPSCTECGGTCNQYYGNRKNITIGEPKTIGMLADKNAKTKQL